jgi:hypothetical protein
VSVNAAAEVSVRLRLIAERAARPAPVAAATAAGRAGETLVKVVLTKRSHALGTPTPSPKGSPPAKISGDLARSVQRTPTAPLGPGRAESTYGPTLFYGTVQEYGWPNIRAKNFPVLGNPTVGFFGKEVTIPARPFMKPSTDLLIASGTAARVMTAAFLTALEI